MSCKTKVNDTVILHFPIFFTAFMLVVFLTGCQTTNGSVSYDRIHTSNSYEAEWIRDGHPIEFENQLWYPADGVESFLDSEMRLMGEHLGIQFFVDKVDVRPYGRLYTKFDNNQFRFFEKRISE